MNEVDVLKRCDKTNDVVVRKCQSGYLTDIGNSTSLTSLITRRQRDE